MDDASRFSVEDAERICAKYYGLQARLEPLPSYIDQNFTVRADDGARYVLKIANPDEPEAALDLQQRAMDWIAARRVGVAPPGGPVDSGRDPVHHPGSKRPGPVRVDGRLPRWGTLCRSPRPSPRPCGRTWAGSWESSTLHWPGFEHPGASGRELVWDLARAAWIVPHIDRITHPERRRIVHTLMARFEEEVEPRLSALRHAVVHNDANDYNVMVDSNTDRVTGIVDFGDMVHGPVVVEVAITVAYAILGQHDPLQAAAEVVKGYHRAFALREEEIDLLFTLVCAPAVRERDQPRTCLGSRSRKRVPGRESARGMGGARGPCQRGPGACAHAAAGGLRVPDRFRSAHLPRCRPVRDFAPVATPIWVPPSASPTRNP